jgi:hypothetical protein
VTIRIHQNKLNIQVLSTGQEALSPEPEPEPVIEAKEDETLTSMPLEEYKELYPKTEMEPNPFVDSQYE